MADLKLFWEETKKVLHSEYVEQGKEEEFSLWIDVIDYIETANNKICVSVPSSFFRDQLLRRSINIIIQNKLFDLSGKKIEISFIVQETNKLVKKESITNTKSIQSTSANLPRTNEEITNIDKFSTSSSIVKKHPQLREDYTFDNFVLGDSNSFAYNAALAVAKNPGRAYNPLLIYGGVGLGKTHLMQAIGNYTWNSKKNKIIYITAETFTNEFIQAINEKTTSKFKSKYRSADILLIDDIHFLQNKIETQEELFYTYEELYNSYKQIVFTCDRPVSELKNLSDRLRSRFERGLNVDLTVPKYETRRAILEKKLFMMNRKIDDKVIDLIAQNVDSNIRDLEASLTKIIAYTDLVQKEVTVEIAQQQLRDTFSSPKQSNIRIDTIIKVIADHYNISTSDIKGKKKTKIVVLPRQLAMYIAREITEYSTTELGTEFGGRDHTTVMHSCEKIENAMHSDSSLEATIQTLIREIKDYKKG